MSINGLRQVSPTPDNRFPHIPLLISRPTFDVEVERVALAVRHGVGGDAGVEPGRGELHGLQHQGLVAEDDALGHVLLEPLTLEIKGLFSGVRIC